VTSILRPLARVSSSSSSTSTPDPDLSDNYPEIGASACREPVEGGRLICMVAPNGDRSHNSPSKYPTIRRSEAFDAQTPSGGLVQNMNPYFNTVRVQVIMETIQRMAPDGSPLLSWLSKELRRQTLSLQRSWLAFPRGNLLSVTTIRQGVPEVKLYRRQVQITVCPSMTHDGVSLRTTLRGDTTVNGMTFTTLLKIGGISGLEHHPHHDGLWWRMLVRWEKVDSVLWRDHSDKSDGQTNSRLVSSTGMMAPSTVKNLFRCIRPSLRPL
jgi:hypothetical protein